MRSWKQNIIQREALYGKDIASRRKFNSALHGGGFNANECTFDKDSYRYQMESNEAPFFPKNVDMEPPLDIPLVYIHIWSENVCVRLTETLKKIVSRVSPKNFSPKFTKFKDAAARWLRSTENDRQRNVFFDDNDPPENVLEDKITFKNRELWAIINENGFVSQDTQPGACRLLDPNNTWDKSYYLHQLKSICKETDKKKEGSIMQTFYASGYMEETLLKALLRDNEFNETFKFAYRYYKDGEIDLSRTDDKTDQNMYVYQRISQHKKHDQCCIL